ncbi:MAG: hypothetical protein Q4A52_02990 [Bacillota bacterium]|nr:hypothetical protein [Bacillota bacterium]
MDFPHVHSDEVWLSGINRTLVSNGMIDRTEPFFDLYPRAAHPFRWLYNLLLAPLTLRFQTGGSKAAEGHLGVSVLAVRALSFVASLVALGFFGRILVFQNQPLWRIAPFALSISFVHASHFGRQDMVILALLLAAYYGALRKRTLCATLLTVAGMGVHPNSLIVGLVVLSALPAGKRLRSALGMLAGFALHVAAGFFLAPDWIRGYLAFGESQGIRVGIVDRFGDFGTFWIKLFEQVSGTYTAWDLRLFLLLGASVLCASVAIRILRGRSQNDASVKALSAVLAGILLIGRFSSLSVLFALPFVLLSVYDGIERIAQAGKSHAFRISAALQLALLLAVGWNLWSNLKAYDDQLAYRLSYGEMIQRIAASVPYAEPALGNLNILEAHDPEAFYDIRNLDHLKGESLEEYLRSRNIRYIIWHDEMDYIARTIERWHILYGDLAYYPEMKRLLEGFEVVDRFENPIYAMRIAAFVGVEPWQTTIYRVVWD